MTVNDLLTLAEREAQRLTDENDHGAAIIIRELAARLQTASNAPTIRGGASLASAIGFST